MRLDELSPGEINRGRRNFFSFTVFNSLSFALLSGNVITLYVLRLGAGSFLVGLLASIVYLAYLIMLPGLLLARRQRLVPLMGRFWILRYVLLAPMLLSPLLVRGQDARAALLLITLSVLGFNLSRCLAITGYNPIVGELAVGRDRGAFLARLQLLVHTTTLVAGATMAAFLGREAPLGRYILFIALGIVTGLLAALIIFRLPEPRAAGQRLPQNPLHSLSAGLRSRRIRRFVSSHVVLSFAALMVTPFLVVYVKQVYGLPDNVVLYLTILGSLGAILMALISGFLVDKLGAKPLYFLFTGVLALVLVPAAVSPRLPGPGAVWAFCGLIFFFHGMGTFGITSSGQTYFLALIRPEERLALGVVYYLIQGLAGGAGALVGGALLEGLHSILYGPVEESFRLYFAALAVGFAASLPLVQRMENLGAYPIRDVIGILFSPRDMRAIGLIHRLFRSRTAGEERSTLQALGASQSELSLREVLQRLKSPRFTVRAEALTALSRLPLNEPATRDLISEVKNHSFTTAYMAAEILGQRGVPAAVPVLRRQLASRDYFLSGKCMVALARLGDRDSIPAVERILRTTRNPRLIIHAAVALETFRSVRSVPLLLSRLRERSSPFLRDELILAAAGTLGLEEWFYPLYTAFLEKSTGGILRLRDLIPAGDGSRPNAERLHLLLRLASRPKRGPFSRLAGSLLSELQPACGGQPIEPLLRPLVGDPRLLRLIRFRFLIAALLVHFSRNPNSDTSSAISTLTR